MMREASTTPDPNSEGLKPEVDEPISAPGASAESIWANTLCLRSSRSGTDSCTQSAPATASSIRG